MELQKITHKKIKVDFICQYYVLDFERNGCGHGARTKQRWETEEHAGPDDTPKQTLAIPAVFPKDVHMEHNMWICGYGDTIRFCYVYFLYVCRMSSVPSQEEERTSCSIVLEIKFEAFLWWANLVSTATATSFTATVAPFCPMLRVAPYRSLHNKVSSKIYYIFFHTEQTTRIYISWEWFRRPSVSEWYRMHLWRPFTCTQ